MTPQQAENVIKDTLAQVAPDADTATAGPDADLRDAFELDSMDFLRFVEILSQQTGHRIDEDDYPHLSTLGNAVKFLAARA